MKSKNGDLVLTLQNRRHLSDLTLDPDAHQEEPDCDLSCVWKGIQVYDTHLDSQSCILQANWMLQDLITLLLNNTCCFRKNMTVYQFGTVKAKYSGFDA